MLGIKLGLGVNSIVRLHISELQALITSLFGNGEQGAFYIPRPVVNGAQALFQDAAGTVPVTEDGDPDGSMADQSPNGHTAVQPTSAARPTYKTDGTLHRLDADGTDDSMILPTALIPSGGALRLTSFAISTTDALFKKVVSFGSNIVDRAWRIGVHSSGAIMVEVSGGESVIGTTLVNDGVSHVVTVYTTGSNLSTTVIRVDGGVDAISSPGSAELNTNSSGTARLFSRETDTAYLTGGFYGMVHLLPSQVISDSKMDDIESYLASLAGVTL